MTSSSRPALLSCADEDGTVGGGAGRRSYGNPYLVGVGLGLCLLAAIVIVGRGLGASGAFTSAVSVAVDAVSSSHARDNGMFAAYLENEGAHPLADWLVFEILGVCVGGLLSGLLARRMKLEIVRGPRVSAAARLALAFTGGALMGFASRLARGCTSGQALTGGALLNVGGWVFMLAMFLAAFGIARLLSREWT